MLLCKGEYIMKHLRQMQKQHPLMGDVRGKGLMIGIEFVKDAKKTKAKEESNQMVLEAFKRGLLLLPCGEKLGPPFSIAYRHKRSMRCHARHLGRVSGSCRETDE